MKKRSKKRVGATSKKRTGNKAGMLAEYGGLAIGGIAASKVANIKLPIALPAPIQSALPLIIGVLIAKKPGFVGALGKGMIAAGGAKLIGALVPQLGVGAAMVDEGIQDYMIEGADGYALAGATDGTSNIGATSYALAGVDNDDNTVFG